MALCLFGMRNSSNRQSKVASLYSGRFRNGPSGVNTYETGPSPAFDVLGTDPAPSGDRPCAFWGQTLRLLHVTYGVWICVERLRGQTLYPRGQRLRGQTLYPRGQRLRGQTLYPRSPRFRAEWTCRDRPRIFQRERPRILTPYLPGIKGKAHLRSRGRQNPDLWSIMRFE